MNEEEKLLEEITLILSKEWARKVKDEYCENKYYTEIVEFFRGMESQGWSLGDFESLKLTVENMIRVVEAASNERA